MARKFLVPAQVTEIIFNTSASPNVLERSLMWDDGEGTLSLGLKGGNVNLQLGQENVALCYNGTGSSIPDGTVVYINGAQGQRPRLALAQANSEATSSKVLGITTETIANGAEGFVTTFGIINGVDTSSFTAGQALWLSPTVAGGLTATKPVAPNHMVFVGYAISINASSGRIFVNPQNGYELDEIHDVLITSKTDKDIIIYDSAQTLWKNQNILSAIGVLPVGNGGTGLSTVASGSILYGSALDTVSGLAIGANNTVLTSNGTAPVWTTNTGTGNVVRATSPTFATSVVGSATMAVFNTTSTTVNAFGAATTLNIGGTPTTAVTATILGNATATGTTKTLNLGTSGASGSTTNINIGSAVSGSTTNITLNGVATAATASVDTNTTQIATTAYVVGQGYLKSATASSTYQPLDADLTAIAALAGTSGLLKKTAADTWTLDTTAYTTNTGTVTSVALSLPAIFTITGSPVTSSGTLTATLANQTTNLVFASPNGSTGTPTFRSLVSDDIPNLDTAKITSGTLGIDRGGTNSTATPTNGGVAYGTGTAYAFTSAGTAGQALVSAGAAAPVWTTLTLENIPGSAFKRSVKVATTANITLSGTQTIDGVAVVAGDRVLVKNQTAQAENGIYIVAAGSWSRSADADNIDEIAGGTVNIDQGTQGSQIWSNNLKTTDTLGTTPIVWNRLMNNGDTVTIGTTAVTLGSSATTFAGITSLTTTTLVNNTHNASSAGQTGALFGNVTTGIVNIGAGLTTGTLNIGATGQTGTITVGRSTGAQTLNLAIGATTSGTTKTVNIGTSGVSGSTTDINIGSAVSGATTNIILNGIPTAATAAAGTNTTQVATTAFVKTAVDTAVPSQTGKANYALSTNGTTTEWRNTLGTASTGEVYFGNVGGVSAKYAGVRVIDTVFGNHSVFANDGSVQMQSSSNDADSQSTITTSYNGSINLYGNDTSEDWNNQIYMGSSGVEISSGSIYLYVTSTGVSAPTVSSSDNSNKVATTAFVKTAISSFTSGPDYSTQFLLMGA